MGLTSLFRTTGSRDNRASSVAKLSSEIIGKLNSAPPCCSVSQPLNRSSKLLRTLKKLFWFLKICWRIDE